MTWTVAINLSTWQFNHPGLIELISRNLKHYSLEPRCLVFEITESTAMRNPEANLSIIKKLHQLGVRISIDDFGTGHSNLLYLKKLPVRELKIDRRFVRDSCQGNEEPAIISALVSLGQALNLEIVVKGVETSAQRDFLRSLGCTSLQGCLLGFPMSPNELIAAIAEGCPEMQVQKGNTYPRERTVTQIPSIAAANV